MKAQQMNYVSSYERAVKSLPYLFLSGIVMVSSCTKTPVEDKKDDDPATCSIVITKADGTTVNTVYVEVYDSTFANNNEANKTGVDQTWDFSALKNHGENSLAFGETMSAFPNSDLSINGLVAFSNRSTGLEMDGFDGVTIMGEDEVHFIMRYDDPFTLVPYSLGVNGTYNDTYSSYSDVLPQDSVSDSDSLRIHYTGANKFVVTGCGKIILPSGTFDCIKYEVTPTALHAEAQLCIGGNWQFLNNLEDGEINYELAPYQSTSYFWVTKDKKFPVCSMAVDDKRKVTSASYFK
jgi:hypothetical protein